MAIMFRCKRCNAKIKVPDDKAGKHGKCPKCANTVLVPLETEPEFTNIRESDTKIVRRRTKPERILKKTSNKHRMMNTGDTQTLKLNKLTNLSFDKDIDLEQTAMLHLPESEMNEPIGRKRKTFKLQSKQTDVGEDDDLLFLDEDKPEMIDDTALVDIPDEPMPLLPDDYFAGFDDDMHADEKTEVVEKQVKPVLQRKSEKHRMPAPKPRKKPLPSAQAKSRISEYKSAKLKPELHKEEETVKKGSGGFFWVFFGIILAIAHTAAAFILGASFMLNRVEKGNSPVDSAFEIMKFDDRLNDIDQKINQTDKTLSKSNDSEETSDENTED